MMPEVTFQRAQVTIQSTMLPSSSVQASGFIEHALASAMMEAGNY